MHVVVPCAAYVPFAHCVHAVAGSLSWSRFPAGQLVHTVIFSAAYLPAAHTTQGVPGALSASACPAAQFVHTVDPTGEYWPATHATHDVLALVLLTTPVWISVVVVTVVELSHVVSCAHVVVFTQFSVVVPSQLELDVTFVHASAVVHAPFA